MFRSKTGEQEVTAGRLVCACLERLLGSDQLFLLILVGSVDSTEFGFSLLNGRRKTFDLRGNHHQLFAVLSFIFVKHLTFILPEDDLFLGNIIGCLHFSNVGRNRFGILNRTRVTISSFTECS